MKIREKFKRAFLEVTYGSPYEKVIDDLANNEFKKQEEFKERTRIKAKELNPNGYNMEQLISAARICYLEMFPITLPRVLRALKNSKIFGVYYDLDDEEIVMKDYEYGKEPEDISDVLRIICKWKLNKKGTVLEATDDDQEEKDIKKLLELLPIKP